VGIVEVVRVAIVTCPAQHEGLEARGLLRSSKYAAQSLVCRLTLIPIASVLQRGFSNRFWVGEVWSANRHIPKLKVKAIRVASQKLLCLLRIVLVVSHSV